MRRYIRSLVLGLSAIVILGEFQNVAAQSASFTNGPNSITNVLGVVFDVEWKDCTGIATVEARVVDKKTGKQLAESAFKSLEASASKLNWQIFLPDSQQGDVVQVTVFILSNTGAEIAKTQTKEVTLKTES